MCARFVNPNRSGGITDNVISVFTNPPYLTTQIQAWNHLQLCECPSRIVKYNARYPTMYVITLIVESEATT
jgi:hypothetical protein